MSFSAAFSAVSTALFAAAVAVSLPQAYADVPLTLNLVHAEGAVCLDGSPPAYYFRGGSDSSKWRIHLRGGAWCFTPEECLKRAGSDLGSSKAYPAAIPAAGGSPDDLPEGFMSDNRTANPGLYDWNVVFVEYCDGSSFTGNRDAPVVVDGTELHFRGFAVLNAVVADLCGSKGLSSATDVILSGTSAGGLATYIHAPHVAALLPWANVVAMPDAGYFLDHPNIHGVSTFRRSFQGAVGPALWNATAGLNPACVSAVAPADVWKCAFAPYTAPFNRVPTFVVNSLYDSAQLGIILQLPCASDIAKCDPQQLAEVAKYRQAFMDAVKPVLAQPGTGCFLTACNQHEETCADGDWHGITVGGTVLSAAVPAWAAAAFAGGSTSTAFQFVDGVWPSNPTCPPHGARHGGC